jgi:hypothetical protein
VVVVWMPNLLPVGENADVMAPLSQPAISENRRLDSELKVRLPPNQSR